MEEDRGKRRSPFAWLLMIPAKVLFDVFFLMLGFALDVIYQDWVYKKREAEGIIEGGHGFMFFIPLFLMIIIVTSVIILFVSVIGTCVKLYLRSREKTAEEWEALRKKTERAEEYKLENNNENRNGYTGNGWKE